MCGIVGYATREPEPGLDEAFLVRACRAMAHRGPDGEGTWSDARVGLGHRRLSIIDIASGAQPMGYDRERLRITFNGEIYNYRELRTELRELGHQFRTSSDTEVILAAYAQWGRDAPRRLRGIFAFAIWDREARELFLARDHFGVKPLFYHAAGGRCVFASELKALLEAECIRSAPDAEGLSDYLALGYSLGHRTILRDVHRLEPAHYGIWRDGRYEVRPFWDLATVLTAHGGDTSRAQPELEEAYGDLLDRAVHAQMVSDVPIGAFLSGGLDSSSVVYFMRAHQPGTLRTFSMGFAEQSYSELDYAERVAASLGTEHHAQLLAPDLPAALPDLVRRFDEPLGDTSVVPTYFLARLARKQVKVVLSGDGADESLAGYDTYVADLLQRLYRRLPTTLHNRVALPASRWIPASDRKVNLGYELGQFIRQAHDDAERAHYGWRLLFEAPDARTMLGHSANGYDPYETYRTHYDAVRHADPLHQSLYVDFKTWLANDILTKVDRASMAVGLESRVPFLDLALVEFTMRLPTNLKMRCLARKVILRRTMRGKLPPMVIRRRKRGFNAPMSPWLRRELRGLAEDLFTATSAFIDTRAPCIRATWTAHLSGRSDHGFRLWPLVSLLLWEREVVRRRAAVNPIGARPALAGHP